MDEISLIKKCQKGEKQAFQTLISFYYPFVSKYLLKLTNDEYLTEDLAQETFLRLIRSIDRYDIYGKASLSTYIMTIAKRLYIDHLRKDKQVFTDLSHTLIDSGQDVEETVIKNMQIKEAVKWLDTLPQEQVVVIKMKYLEQKTLEEIAQQLNIQPKTVKSRIHNGIIKIRQALRRRNLYE